MGQQLAKQYDGYLTKNQDNNYILSYAIQTDKPVYKIGETVLIKVFQYNKIDKKPCETKLSKKLKIIDANDNEIKVLNP